MTASMKLPRCLRRTFFGAAATALLASCQIGEPYRPEPRPGLGKYLAERAALIVTLPEKDATALLQKFHSSTQSTLSLSTATPVSAEGHFLTSAHSVKALRPGDVSVILYSPGKHQRQGRVEILWQDESADLALVRAPFSTPFYYSWLPRDKWLAPGTQVIHGGMQPDGPGDVGCACLGFVGRVLERDLTEIDAQDHLAAPLPWRHRVEQAFLAVQRTDARRPEHLVRRDRVIRTGAPIADRAWSSGQD